MTEYMNFRPLSHNQFALDIGKQTTYFRNRNGIIESRPFGQGYYDRIGYINPSLSSQRVDLSFPSYLFGK